MATPARKTSKAKKQKRRTHKKISVSGVSYDQSVGMFRRSHHISPDGYYKGRKVID